MRGVLNGKMSILCFHLEETSDKPGSGVMKNHKVMPASACMYRNIYVYEVIFEYGSTTFVYLRLICFG
jgi:hypothetical protein